MSPWEQASHQLAKLVVKTKVGEYIDMSELFPDKLETIRSKLDNEHLDKGTGLSLIS